MTPIDAFILGIVQGVTEFLPVSSSGHLVLTQHLLGIEKSGELIHFDLVCHVGTLFAIIAIFHKEMKEALLDTRKRRELLLATLPLFPLVFLLKPIKGLFSDISLLGFFFLFNSFLLLAGEIFKSKKEPCIPAPLDFFRNLLWLKKSVIFVQIFNEILRACVNTFPKNLIEKMPKRMIFTAKWNFERSLSKDALVIGLFQAIAIVPGISRSGSTITGARLLGWSKESAIVFSFLIGSVAITGGFFLETAKLLQEKEWHFDPMVYGIAFITSFVSGFFALRLLIHIATRRNLVPFAVWTLIIGLYTLYKYG